MKKSSTVATPKIFFKGDGTRKQYETAMQFVQLDIQKMKRAVMNLEEKNSSILSKIPGELTKTTENLIAQVQALTQEYAKFNSVEIEKLLNKCEDSLTSVTSLISKDIENSEQPIQTTAFINTFSEDIANRLITTTDSLDLNLELYINKQLQDVEVRPKPKLKFEKPELFTTAISNARTYKIPKSYNEPIDKLLRTQMNQLDTLFSEIQQLSKERKDMKIPQKSKELLITCEQDEKMIRNILVQLNIIEMENKSKVVVPKQTQEELIDEIDMPADPAALDDIKAEAEKCINQLRAEYDESKIEAKKRIKKLKAQISEQEARLSAFDDLGDILQGKLSYIQYKSDDLMSQDVGDLKSADAVVSAIDVYTKQLERNMGNLIDRASNQLHRISISVPFG